MNARADDRVKSDHLGENGEGAGMPEGEGEAGPLTVDSVVAVAPCCRNTRWDATLVAFCAHTLNAARAYLLLARPTLLGALATAGAHAANSIAVVPSVYRRRRRR